MPRYSVNRVKPLSSRRRYEFLREHGVTIETGGSHPKILKGQALDDYIDEKVWRDHHPGEEPRKEWGYPITGGD